MERQVNDITKAIHFLMIDSVDHRTGKIGLTPTVTIMKEGGDFITPSGTIAEKGNGWYKLIPAITDVDTLGTLILHAEAPTADQADEYVQIVAYNPNDTVRLGLTSLPNVIVSGTGGLKDPNTRVVLSADQPDYAPALQTTLQTVGVNVTSISGAVWDELLTGSTHNINRSAGRRLRQVGAYSIYENTLPSQIGVSANAVKLDSGASNVNGSYDPALITIIAGTGEGQTRTIYQYIGATRMAHLDRDWKIQPDETSEYQILSDAGREEVNEGLVTSGTSNTVTLNANASNLDDNYKGQLVFIRSGIGQDQVRLVSSYNGTTHTATVSEAWGIIPISSSCYVMLPNHIFDLNDVANEIDNVLTSAHGAGAWDAVTDIGEVVLSAGQPHWNLAEVGDAMSLSNATRVVLSAGQPDYDLPTEMNATINKNEVISNILTRLATSGYTAPDNSTIANIAISASAIKERTDRLPDSPSSEISASANRNSIISGINLIPSNVDTLLSTEHGDGFWDAISNSPVVLSASQPYYRPAIAGDDMTLTPSLLASVVKHGDLIDGANIDYILEAVLAMVNGNFSVSGDTLTLYKRDNTTPFSIINKTSTTRVRVS